MNAIPTKLPDGTIINYVCGNCYRNPGVQPCAPDLADRVALIQRFAEECCVCRKCGKTPAVAGKGATHCADCEAAMQEQVDADFAEHRAAYEAERAARPKRPDTPKSNEIARLLEYFGVDEDDLDEAVIAVLAVLG